MPTGFRCHLIGSESLLVQCAELVLARDHEILSVITDGPAVLDWAAENGIAVTDPKSDLVAALSGDSFEYLFAITHLAMIPEALLALPTKAAINFHDGPLPAYAGLNATSWALLHQEAEHGITWHRMTAAADEGDLLKQRRFPIAPRETSLTLNTRCWEAGIETFSELLDEIGEDRLVETPQDLSGRSYFGRNDRPARAGTLDWAAPTAEIAAWVRALDWGAYANPLASAKIDVDGTPIVVRELREVDAADAAPGTVLEIGEGWTVATSDGAVELRGLSRAGAAPEAAAALAEALGVSTGRVLERLSDERAAALTERCNETARFEPFWRRRLLRVSPFELPFSERQAAADGAEHTLEHPLTAASLDAAIAALGVLFDRLASVEDGYLRFDPGAAPDPYFSDAVPLRIRRLADASAGALRQSCAEELERVRARDGFLRDLIGREPGLGGEPAYRMALAAGGEAPALGACEAAIAVDVAAGVVRGRFRADRFSAAAAGQFLERMAQLHDRIVAEPDAAVASLPLVNDDERAKLLSAFDETAVAFDRSRCVHEWIEAQVDATPDAPAVAAGDVAWSYRVLDERANQLAHHLRSLGVGPDVMVGLHLERSAEMLVGMLGILKAGGAYVPLDPAFPADRVALMVEDSGATVIVTEQSIRADLGRPDATLVSIDGDAAAIEARPTTRPESGVTPAHLAYVIYTSGSTGRPKGVQVEHRNVANFFVGMDAHVPHDPPGSWLAVTSLSFDISVLELLWTLARGFQVVVHNDANKTAGGPALEHADRPIDFSLFYFASEDSNDPRGVYRLLMEGARFADSHGFAAVWTPERHFHAFGGLYPNPSVTGAAVAAVTEHVQIRSGSVVLPLHHPIRVAEEWSVVDNLSNGRVGLSFAAGWQPNDFVIRPEGFENAKGRMFDDLEVVRKLWRGEEMTFPGPKGDVTVSTLPRPVQAELPVWVTTAGNADTYERAARAGANILTHLLGQTVEELAEKIALYRRVWKECGHPGDGHVSLMLHTFVSDDGDAVRDIVREPMKKYLGSSLSLIKEAAWSFPTFQKMSAERGQSPEEIFEGGLTGEEMDALLEFAFERYYGTSGLFGTPEQCLEMVDRLKGIGVSEIAALVDFGVPTDTALEALKHLDELRRLSEPRSTPRSANDARPGELIEQHGVTHLQCTPSMAGMLLQDDEARAALARIEVLLLGGEALPLSLAQELREATPARLQNMYGPTETTIWSSTDTVDPATGEVTIGRAIANTALYILDANQALVPPGVPGELWIGGEGVVRGYWQRPDLNADRFRDDPYREAPAARMYRTGDLVRLREDGRIEFLGRLDHQVKVRGYRIELGEIEAALAASPAVRECVVVAREDDPGDKRLVAYVIPTERDAFDDGALRSLLRESLPEYMVPTNVVPMARFPLTPNAKIDRKALPAPKTATQRRAPVSAEARPAGELQEQIASIWQTALQIDEVGLDDNFFDLGGHSLLAVRVHRELKEQLQQPISITDLFRLPTIRLLSAHLSGEGEDDLADRTKDRASARRAAMSRRRGRRGRRD